MIGQSVPLRLRTFKVNHVSFTCSADCNKIQPSEALRQYRSKMNHNCKLIIIATSANKFSIADPCDPFGMLDIAGFDADTPNVIRDFVLQVKET